MITSRYNERHHNTIKARLIAAIAGVNPTYVETQRQVIDAARKRYGNNHMSDRMQPGFSSAENRDLDVGDLVRTLNPKSGSVNDANEDDNGAGADGADDSDANNDDANVDDDINSAAEDGSDDGHTFNQGYGHDGQRNDFNDAAHHDHQHHDENIDDSEKYDDSTGAGHDDRYDPNDASYIADQHGNDQYDDQNDRNDY